MRLFAFFSLVCFSSVAFSAESVCQKPVYQEECLEIAPEHELNLGDFKSPADVPYRGNSLVGTTFQYIENYFPFYFPNNNPSIRTHRCLSEVVELYWNVYSGWDCRVRVERALSGGKEYAILKNKVAECKNWVFATADQLNRKLAAGSILTAYCGIARLADTDQYKYIIGTIVLRNPGDGKPIQNLKRFVLEK